MRKLYIVKNQRDFDRIIKEGRYRKNSSYVIYYEKNRVRLLAKEQAWRDANREECRAKWNAYHSAHREERNAKRRANLSQKCIYNDEELTLNALFQRFRGRGITHAMLEAKKYLVTSENIPTE